LLFVLKRKRASSRNAAQFCTPKSEVLLTATGYRLVRHCEISGFRRGVAEVLTPGVLRDLRIKTT